MYYVDYLAMIASYLKPNQYSTCGVSRLRNPKRLSIHNKKTKLLKPLIASICFLLCIAFVPEKPTNLGSICQKYNPSIACQVW